MNTAEDQIDSLVIQGVILVRSQQTARELELRKKELGFLISIDRIRDASTDSAELHSAIVDLIAEGMDANLCLLFLAQWGAQSSAQGKTSQINRHQSCP